MGAGDWQKPGDRIEPARADGNQSADFEFAGLHPGSRLYLSWESEAPLRPPFDWISERLKMIAVVLTVLGIAILAIVGGAIVVWVVAAHAPEGFEDELGFHSRAGPPTVKG